MNKSQTGQQLSARAAELLPAATSELNNLLQIIAGTVKLLENLWDGDSRATKYFEMLRMSTDRATQVMGELTEEAGGSERKILLHPSLARPASARPRNLVRTTQRVMVVDDEPMALVLSKHVLTQAGYEVITAQSGRECLDLYQMRPGDFDLVLLDLTMPEIDGEETFTRLRAIDPHATVVLNTGFIAEHRLERMMADGLAGFVRRPYQPSEVVEQIRAILAASQD